jgi:hypothetical protein
LNATKKAKKMVSPHWFFSTRKHASVIEMPVILWGTVVAMPHKKQYVFMLLSGIIN